jgi:hypothetical protein
MMFRRSLGHEKEDPSVRAKMPKENTPVTISRAGGPTVSGSIANLDAKTFTIRTQLKGQAGATYFVNYQSMSGKHRFGARCVEASANSLVLGYPAKIDTVEESSQANSGRQSVRLDMALRCEWRSIKDGKPETPFTRGTLVDISRTGASMVLDFELASGTLVELRVTFNSQSAPLILAGEVRRVSAAEQAKRLVHGIQFHTLAPEQEKAIVAYIHHRQAERRHRGLL